MPRQDKPKEEYPEIHSNQTEKIKGKEKNIKSNKVKITYKGNPIRLLADLLAEALQERREWCDIFKMVKGKNLQPRILYSVRLSFTFYGEIKGFKDKQKLKRIQHNQSSFAAAAAAKSLQLCLTLCDPIDGSPPGSPIPGILQARTLEWVAISFSNAGK